ncbi:MAG: choice-of-anchor D domain-containing protein [Acidobacteriaceae bacterium]
MRARAQHAAMLKARSAASPAPTVWQPVGPSQVITPAWNLVTGRVTGIVADPSDATGNTVYIGTSGGGVWKSINAAGAPAAVTFAPLTDDLSTSPSASLSSLSIGAVSVQPGGTGVVLAGTGDPNDATDSWYGVGVLRSADGGLTWTLKSQTGVTQSYSAYTFTGNAFAGFAWSSLTPNRVVAAVTQSEYGAVLQMPGQQGILGLYYSSDAGATWQLATLEDGSQVVQSAQTAENFGNAATSVVWNPVRGQFYAAIRYHGYYQSADGITWTRLAKQPGTTLTAAMCPPNPFTVGSMACPLFRGTLAVQPETGDMFALTVDANNLDQGLWQDACQLNAGACASVTVQFATRIPDQPLDSVNGDGTIPEGVYNLTLTAVPAQQDTLLFAGTTDLWRCSLANSCAWRNTTNTQTCAAAQVAPAQHAVDATFGVNGLLYFGNDGGLWRTTDAVNQQQPPCSADDATHFQNLNSGLGSLAEVESLSESPGDASTYLAALGALGTAASASGQIPWNQVLNGEGNVVAIDPANADNWYATSAFGVGINGCPDGAGCDIADFGSIAVGETQVEDDVQLIPAPWILDPVETADVILGTCRVWRGPVTGTDWSAENLLSGILDGGAGPACDGNSEIRSLAAGVDTAGGFATEQLYAGMAGAVDGGNLIPGHVFTAGYNSASPAAITWTDDYGSPVTNSGAAQFDPGGFDISSIYVDPHDSTGKTIYVTVQGYSDGGGAQDPTVYQSSDAGAHWLNLTSNLPSAPGNAVLVDPNDANIVYVALDTGVYYTQNVASCASTDSNCWGPFASGLPNVPVTALTAWNQASTQELRAGTYGRGIWRVGLATAGIATTPATAAPSPLSFAAETIQTVSPPQTVTVTDTGTLNLNIASVSINGDFTESDNCRGASIAPAASCTLQVTFDPSQMGARAGMLTVFANVTGGQLQVSLSGMGVTSGTVVLAPSALTFAARSIGTTSAPQQVVVDNTNGVAATLTAETVTGDFAISNNTCASSLAAQSNCQIAIVFKPTASGNLTGDLTVTDSQGSQTAILSGIGQAIATDTLSTGSLTFTAQAVGTASPAQTVTLTNSGDQSLTGILISAGSGFTQQNNCGLSLAGHGNCAIAVTFSPVATGPVSAILNVTDELRTQTVELAGTGVVPAGVSATPSAVSFGGLAVGSTSPVQTVTVTNKGGVELTGLAPAVSSGFTMASNNCSASLSIGAACQIGLTFSPATAGAFTGTLTIAAANLATPLQVALTGSGEDFSIGISGTASTVITSGASAQFAVQLAGLAGSSGTVALVCTGAPQNAACSLNPTSIAVSGSATSSATLSIATGTETTALLRPAIGWKWPTLLAIAVPLGWIGLRRRRPAGWSMILAALALMIASGCGVSSSGGSGSGGGGGGGGGGAQYPTPPGTYVITVTATMSNITHSTAVNLTVE